MQYPAMTKVECSAAEDVWVEKCDRKETDSLPLKKGGFDG